MARVGIYVDDVYKVVDGVVSVDRAFLLFACAVGDRLGSAVVFGRTVEDGRAADYALPVTELVRLPHYTNLRRPGEVVRAAAGTAHSMWRGLGRVDQVWVFGPHPFGFVLIALALVRGRRVALGVRQDTRAYARARLGAKTTAVTAVRAMDAVHRALARRLKTIVVGTEIAAQYGNRPTVLPIVVSLVRRAEVASEPRPLGAPPWTLLSVGRLEVEKNPLLLVEALAELDRRRPGAYRLTWIGRGELEPDVRRRASELGVAPLIDLRGYVPFGPELLDLYRRADVLVHVSLTEGVPQVLAEAHATATPVVATAVGGIPAALENGAGGLLVPPADLEALVAAVERVVDDADVRERIVRRGLELARRSTLEAETARVASFLRDS